MGLYDSNDLYWTWDGDLAVGDDGDIKETMPDALQSLRQEIATIVKSEINEWEAEPSLGCTLSDFMGEPNTRENGQAIEDRIRLKLAEANIVQREDLNVRVVPTGPHQIMIMINVSVLATAQNQLTLAEPVNVSLLYDTMENNLFFMPPTINEET
jgi:hypothetical protein